MKRLISRGPPSGLAAGSVPRRWRGRPSPLRRSSRSRRGGLSIALEAEGTGGGSRRGFAGGTEFSIEEVDDVAVADVRDRDDDAAKEVGTASPS